MDKWMELLKIDCAVGKNGDIEMRMAMSIGKGNEKFASIIEPKIIEVSEALAKQLMSDYIKHCKRAAKEEKREGVIVDFMESLEKLKSNDIIK